MTEPTIVSSPCRPSAYKRLNVLNREINGNRGFVNSIENLYELQRWKNLPNQSLYNSSCSMGYIVAADIDKDKNEYVLYCSENRFIRMCELKHLRDKKTIYLNFEVRSAAYVQLGPSIETYLVGTNEGSIKLFSLEDSIMLDNVQSDDSKFFNSIHWNTKDKRNPFLAFAAKGKHQADVFDFVSGMKNLAVATNGGECTAVSWNPSDCNLITLGTSEGNVEHYDVRKTRTLLHSSREFKDSVITVNYTEDGLYVVVLYSNRKIIVSDAVSLKKLVTAHLPPKDHSLSLKSVGLHVRIHSCGHSIYVGIPCREITYYVEIDTFTKEFSVRVLKSPFGGMTCCAFVPQKQHFLTFGRAQLTWQAALEDVKGTVRTLHSDNWEDTSQPRRG